MAETQRKVEDERVHDIRDGLIAHYKVLHPKAQIDVKRYNSVCVWVRVLDPDFTGKDMIDREDEVWKVLEGALPDDVATEISMLILLTPRESKRSQLSMEFDDPAPNMD